jgi:starvation-inducible DNA-binding protein
VLRLPPNRPSRTIELKGSRMGAPRTEPQGALDDESLWSPSLDAVREISSALNALIADLFTLHLKTKNFHWHVRGPQFRNCHLMFDEQADQIFDAVDLVAERVRKVGGSTIRSVEHVCRLARLKGNDTEIVSATDMLDELRRDNRKLAQFMRDAHLVCTDWVDVASASLLETLIDQVEKRVWFLTESRRST